MATPDRLVDLFLGDPPRDLPPDEARDYYVSSYLWIRTSVGLLGALLPIAFIVGEAYFLAGGVQVRGSISAYYHSQLEDLFVAGLSTIGFLLVTYMSGHPRTRVFWYSLAGGVALLGVVFLPTWRPSVPTGAPLCGAVPSPPGCSPVEQALGEATTAHIHAGCAIAFVLSLALMSFLFARDELVKKNDRRMQLFHAACGVLILLAGAWAFLGTDVGPLKRLYLGEVVAVWAFAASWSVKGRKIRELLHAARALRRPRTPSGPLRTPAPRPAPRNLAPQA